MVLIKNEKSEKWEDGNRSLSLQSYEKRFGAGDTETGGA